MNIAPYSVMDLVILGLSVYFIAVIFCFLYIANNIEYMRQSKRNLYKGIISVVVCLMVAGILGMGSFRIGWLFAFDGFMCGMVVQQIVGLKLWR
jgi:glucan phosphoethanolaminetransferase (alkaline phosphatase superfamily)